MMRRNTVGIGVMFGAMLLAAFGNARSASATPIPLSLPASTAFSILGASCGGIQEQAQATGFDAASGYPTGDVYLQTRCGGSGRGGGYHVTVHSAWIAVTWDFTGAVTAYTRLASAPAGLDPAFSAFDAFGNQLYTVLSATNVQPSACSVGNTTYCAYRTYLELDPAFVPAPRVTSISIATGPAAGGTSVTIAGSGFTGASGVDFGATAAATFTVNNDTSITAVAPAATAGTVDVTVTTAGGTSAAIAEDQFTFVGVPSVSAIDPNSGAVTGGDTVTITGTNLATATAVTFGGVPAGFTINDDTSITATSPGAEAAEAVHVRVTTIGGTSATTAADRFTFLAIPAPIVSTLSPNSGSTAGGDIVTITGANFTTASVVTFGDMPAEFTINDDASITAISPAASTATTVDVVVFAAGGSSATGAADQFTYTDPTSCGDACVSTIQCARLTGTLTGTMALSMCTPMAPMNRHAHLVAGSDTFTWSPSGETTIVSLTATSPGQGGCRAGRVEYDISGTVTGGTSTYTAVGDLVSARACMNPNGKLSLVKHTKFGL